MSKTVLSEILTHLPPLISFHFLITRHPPKSSFCIKISNQYTKAVSKTDHLPHMQMPTELFLKNSLFAFTYLSCCLQIKSQAGYFAQHFVFHGRIRFGADKDVTTTQPLVTN